MPLMFKVAVLVFALPLRNVSTVPTAGWLLMLQAYAFTLPLSRQKSAPPLLPCEEPDPDRTVQVLVAAQPYRLEPGAAFVLKNISAVSQVAGRTVPILTGFVFRAAEKSTPRLCVRKSIWVCA